VDGDDDDPLRKVTEEDAGNDVEDLIVNNVLIWTEDDII
jgi:hypothetical protein